MTTLPSASRLRTRFNPLSLTYAISVLDQPPVQVSPRRVVLAGTRCNHNFAAYVELDGPHFDARLGHRLQHCGEIALPDNDRAARHQLFALRLFSRICARALRVRRSRIGCVRGFTARNAASCSAEASIGIGLFRLPAGEPRLLRLPNPACNAGDTNQPHARRQAAPQNPWPRRNLDLP